MLNAHFLVKEQKNRTCNWQRSRHWYMGSQDRQWSSIKRAARLQGSDLLCQALVEQSWADTGLGGIVIAASTCNEADSIQASGSLMQAGIYMSHVTIAAGRMSSSLEPSCVCHHQSCIAMHCKGAAAFSPRPGFCHASTPEWAACLMKD